MGIHNKYHCSWGRSLLVEYSPNDVTQDIEGFRGIPSVMILRYPGQSKNLNKGNAGF